jgi:HNH endonuclease
MSIRVDITRKKFGLLTALEPAGKRANHTMWVCQCICGEEIEVRLGDLRRGHTISCGCKTGLVPRKPRPNRYKTVGPDTFIRLTSGKVVIIDTDQQGRVGRYHWTTDSDGRPTACRGTLRLPRLIMGVNRLRIDILVDHKNGDPLDNRKGNLRVCTIAENNCNRGPAKSNKLGLKGVRENADGTFRVDLTHEGERHSRGPFLNKWLAAESHDVLARKYHGEFAWLNQEHVEFPAGFGDTDG